MNLVVINSSSYLFFDKVGILVWGNITWNILLRYQVFFKPSDDDGDGWCTVEKKTNEYPSVHVFWKWKITVLSMTEGVIFNWPVSKWLDRYAKLIVPHGRLCNSLYTYQVGQSSMVATRSALVNRDPFY